MKQIPKWRRKEMMKRRSRLRRLMLVLTITVTLLVTLMPFGAKASPTRNVDINVINIDDSHSSYVGSTENVKSGVLDAVNDAITNTRVKLSGEQINVNEVTDIWDLYDLVITPPIHATFINTHGEVVPMPDAYFGPAVHITYPGEGWLFAESFINVMADVYTIIPGFFLEEQTFPGGTGYVFVRVYDSYNNLVQEPIPMKDYNDGNGGTYYRKVYTRDWSYGDYRIEVFAKTWMFGYQSLAYVTISYVWTPPGGGGCPYVSTWDGTDYVLDNNILTASESSEGIDVVDYYKLEKPLEVDGDGNYSLLLGEYEEEHSFLDQAQLLAVDHSPNVNVAVSPDGEVLTYTEPFPAVSAVDNEHKNARFALNSVDGDYYEGHNGTCVTLNFGHPDLSQGAKLVLRADGGHKKSVHIQIQDDQGNWANATSVIPRVYWATEIVDLSEWIADVRGSLKLRLYFTATHKLDFVGLDTSPNAPVEVQRGQLITAEHSTGLKITRLNLLDSDDFYAELTPGQQIELKFNLPTQTTEVRDLIFVVEGRYKKAGDPAYACIAAWQDWFYRIAENTRERGWIWANVAGYPFYYFGNDRYAQMWNTMLGENYDPTNDPMQPKEEGLRQFLGRSDVSCYYYDGHEAIASYDFDLSGFLNTYRELSGYEIVGASRPIPASADLPWDCLGYVDTTDGSHATVAIAMCKPQLYIANKAGMFVHSGLSPDADQNGYSNTFQDDWLKGYVATAMAIEEARSLITWPVVLTVSHNKLHAAAFSVSMRPGDRGLYWDGHGHYTFVKLLFTIGAHYEHNIPFLSMYEFFLSQADLDLSTSDDARFEIFQSKSGLDTGGGTPEIMDDLLWWNIGTLAGAIPVVGAYLGPAVGLLPILLQFYDPEWQSPPGVASHVWANGTDVDGSVDDQGTISFYAEVRFYGIEGQGPEVPYTFTVKMASWLGWIYILPPGSVTSRGFDLPYSTQLTFDINWNIAE